MGAWADLGADDEEKVMEVHEALRDQALGLQEAAHRAGLVWESQAKRARIEAEANSWQGFAVGMAGWVFILLEIICSEGGGQRRGSTSFNNRRLIVTVGWAIYPAGYFSGYLLGEVDNMYFEVIFNYADLLVTKRRRPGTQVLPKAAAQRCHIFQQHAFDCHCRRGHLPCWLPCGLLARRGGRCVSRGDLQLRQKLQCRGDTHYNNALLIVTDGWAIYSADYYFGHLLGERDDMYFEVIFNFAKDCSAEVPRLSTTCV